jgi:hypothetical protein
MRGRWLVLIVVLSLAGVVRAADYERPPLAYSSSTPDNVISKLEVKLAAGKAKLEYDPGMGYLPALLRELGVPVSSQTLVFSQTSLQRQRISPRTPRALYFSDDVYVGYCHHGEVLEISAADAKLGTVFYTLAQNRDQPPRFARQTDNCLLCHASSQTQSVPGHLLRSVFADAQGQPLLSEGTYRVDQTTPFEQRWGGWYVTGTHGKQTHLGNLIVRTPRVARPVENPDSQNVTDLGDRIEKAAYLSAHSDLVALMVLEHQTEAHNLLTRANFEGRLAVAMEESLNREMKLPPDHSWDSTGVRIRSVGEALLRYLLFSQEPPLTEKVCGTSNFAQEFSQRGPCDARGRSLRDFDLEKRLFRYPLSYLIYSPSFAALPDRVKEYVWQRLDEVLTGKDTSKPFAHLSPEDRQAIREILLATHPNVPASWRP